MDELPRPEPGLRWHNVLRWLCVIPAACAAGWLMGGVVPVLFSRAGVDFRAAGYPAFLFPLLQTLPSGLAFAVVGAATAPSRRVTAALLLSVPFVMLSVAIHILSQAHPGLTNYMHSSGQTLGAVAGVLGVHYFTKGADPPVLRKT